MKHLPTLTFWLTVIALCLVAHGCKNTGGSTFLEEGLATLGSVFVTVASWALGEKAMSLVWGAITWIIIKFFQGPRTPFEVHGTTNPIHGAPGNPPEIEGWHVFGFVIPWVVVWIALGYLIFTKGHWLKRAVTERNLWLLFNIFMPSWLQERTTLKETS